VLVHFENDLRGFYSVSQVSAGRKCSLGFEVNGSEGSLAWNAEDPNTLWIGRREKANESLIKDPSLLSPEARGYAAYPAATRKATPTRSFNFSRTITHISTPAISKRRDRSRLSPPVTTSSSSAKPSLRALKSAPGSKSRGISNFAHDAVSKAPIPDCFSRRRPVRAGTLINAQKTSEDS